MPSCKHGLRAVARVGRVLNECCFDAACVACGEGVGSRESRESEDTRLLGVAAAARYAGVCSSCLRRLLDELLPIAAAEPGPACAPYSHTSHTGHTGHNSRCSRCSRTLISEHELCAGCRATEFAFSEAYALFEYRGLARKLLWLYKFENHKPLAELFAALLYHGRLQQRSTAAVVPVPAQRRSRARRGWDQIEVIARRLRRSYAIPVVRALTRARGKASQKQLGRHDRFAQAALQYRVAAAKATKVGVPAAGSVVLLDDVITTGATASACAELLIAAGAGRVEVVSLMVR